MAHWSRLRVRDALSSKNLGSEPGELPLTKMKKKNMKNLFMLFTFMLDFSMGPLLISQSSLALFFFSHWKEHILLKKKREKSVPFSITPIYFTFSILPRFASLGERKQPEGGSRFSPALRPPSLSNSSRPPLLCMKHRSRLKAFSGHSDTEEKRSSELY